MKELFYEILRKQVLCGFKKGVIIINPVTLDGLLKVYYKKTCLEPTLPYWKDKIFNLAIKEDAEILIGYCKLEYMDMDLDKEQEDILKELNKPEGEVSKKENFIYWTVSPNFEEESRRSLDKWLLGPHTIKAREYLEDLIEKMKIREIKEEDKEFLERMRNDILKKWSEANKDIVDVFLGYENREELSQTSSLRELLDERNGGNPYKGEQPKETAKEDSKYYTPSIEEFKSGFEYEIISFGNKWEKAKWNQQPIFDFPNGVRVKYLDSSDIESLGFKTVRLGIFNSYDDKHTIALWSKCDLVIKHNHFVTEEEKKQNVLYDVHTSDPQLFSGTIKNISELKVLLTQLGISIIQEEKKEPEEEGYTIPFMMNQLRLKIKIMDIMKEMDVNDPTLMRIKEVLVQDNML